MVSKVKIRKFCHNLHGVMSSVASINSDEPGARPLLCMKQNDCFEINTLIFSTVSLETPLMNHLKRAAPYFSSFSRISRMLAQRLDYM